MEEKEYLADLHVHSIYSPACFGKGYACQSKIEDILKAAKKAGLKGIAVTDHNRIEGSIKAAKMSKKYGIVAVPSVEISSRNGHVIALNIESMVKKNMGIIETIENVHGLGGIAVCAHPLLKFFGTGKKRISPFDGIECANGREGRVIRISNIGRNQFITGGSDAHTLKEIGSAVTVFSEGFSTKDEMLELLRRKKSSCRIMKKTSKVFDIAIPQLKNIKDYHKDLIFGNLNRNKE